MSDEKLLVVSQSILPNAGGSSYIMENLARQFTTDEMAVFGELRPFQKPHPRQSIDSPAFHHFRSRISIFGRGERFLSSLRWRMLPLVVSRICQIAKRESCSSILGVYPDEMFCYASMLAAKRLGLPFSTYFHNTYQDNVAVNQARAARLQPEIFERSRHIFVMSDGMKRFYEEKYGGDKFVTLRHTYADTQVNSSAHQIEQESTQPSPSGKTRLVLFGTFNESNLEATRRLISVANEHDQFEVHLYTNVPKLLLQHRGVDTSKLFHHGFIADEQLISEIEKYDIQVLTHGFDGAYGEIEYRTIFPTRTIPMLRANRPIFVHSPSHAYINEFIREYDAGLIVDRANPDAVLEGLTRLVDDPVLAQRKSDNATQAAQLFRGSEVAKVLREQIFPC